MAGAWRWMTEEPSFEERLRKMDPPRGRTFIPWLLMATGPVLDVAYGKVALPWLAGCGLAVFVVGYIWTVFAVFRPDAAADPRPRRVLWALIVLTYTLTIPYGGHWLLLFPLVSLLVGALLRHRLLGLVVLTTAGSAGVIGSAHGGGFWSSMSAGYGTALSGLVTAAILSLFEAVNRLRETRQELARTAVAEERLRFSRDLHDLLGHTLSVVVVKSEAVRRLAPRDLEAALRQAADIESVGRQALTEIREAVTGYREGSLATELDRARSALRAVGVETLIRESGPALSAQTEALLGWVVREGVTNVVRHSRASRCEITLSGDGERVRLLITDDGGARRGGAEGGDGSGPGRPPGSGSGIAGLSERLAAAGGSLVAGATDEGFRVEAVVAVEAARADTAARAGGSD